MKFFFLKNIFRTVVWLFCTGCVPAFAQSAEPAAASSDSDFKLSIAGRIHLDAAAYGEDGVAMDNGFLFRRAQLGASVTVGKDWNFKTNYDFAENSAKFSDVYIRYNGFEDIRITAGQFKMPFSLEELTSSNNITFMERSLPSVFSAARRIGIGADVQQPLFTASAAVYGRAVGASLAGDEPFAVGGRVTFTPIKEDGRVLHIGGALAYEWTDDANNIRIRQRPESKVDGNRLSDTGAIANAVAQFKYGIELAGVYGPFSLQGEYMGSYVKRSGALTSFNSNGYYIMGSWLLTGESRKYKGGTFSGVSPARKYGAVEVAVRYSKLDLNDEDIFGGKMKNISVGTNWYINRNVRMMLNYVRVNADAFGPRIDDPNIFQLRLQANF